MPEESRASKSQHERQLCALVFDHGRAARVEQLPSVRILFLGHLEGGHDAREGQVGLQTLNDDMLRHMRIALDIETTGLDGKRTPELGGDEILALAIVSQTGKPLFDKTFHPRKHISWPQAQRINNISPASIDACPFFSEQKSAIQKIINDADEIIAFNASFDLSFLARDGISFRNITILDPMIEFSIRLAELHGKHTVKYQKLETALQNMKIPRQGMAHTALSDALAALEVQHALDEGWGIR